MRYINNIFAAAVISLILSAGASAQTDTAPVYKRISLAEVAVILNANPALRIEPGTTPSGTPYLAIVSKEGDFHIGSIWGQACLSLGKDCAGLRFIYFVGTNKPTLSFINEFNVSTFGAKATLDEEGDGFLNVENFVMGTSAAYITDALRTFAAGILRYDDLRRGKSASLPQPDLPSAGFADEATATQSFGLLVGRLRETPGFADSKFEAQKRKKLESFIDRHSKAGD